MAEKLTVPGVLGVPVVVLGAGVAETFKQVPILFGRQLVHGFPAFTQAQPLHEPVLLHLQQATISQYGKYQNVRMFIGNRCSHAPIYKRGVGGPNEIKNGRKIQNEASFFTAGSAYNGRNALAKHIYGV